MVALEYLFREEAPQNGIAHRWAKDLEGDKVWEGQAAPGQGDVAAVGQVSDVMGVLFDEIHRRPRPAKVDIDAKPYNSVKD